MSSKKCKHPACTCIVTDGKDYCSNSCEDAGDTTELACQCGHPGCAGEELRA